MCFGCVFATGEITPEGFPSGAARGWSALCGAVCLDDFAVDTPAGGDVVAVLLGPLADLRGFLVAGRGRGAGALLLRGVAAAGCADVFREGRAELRGVLLREVDFVLHAVEAEAHRLV